MFSSALIDAGEERNNVVILIFEVVAERFHIIGRGLIAVDKDEDLFSDAGFSIEDHLIQFLGGSDEGLMFFEGVGKQLIFLIMR